MELWAEALYKQYALTITRIGASLQGTVLSFMHSSIHRMPCLCSGEIQLQIQLIKMQLEIRLIEMQLEIHNLRYRLRYIT